MAIRFFSDPVQVLSIGCNPIQVLLIQSRFRQSDPIRSGPGFVNAQIPLGYLVNKESYFAVLYLQELNLPDISNLQSALTYHIQVMDNPSYRKSKTNLTSK